MPFDPNKPASGSPLSSGEMRNQLVALKALIDSIPAGPPGPPGPPGDTGPQGPPFADAVVDGVSTGAPGDAASVSVSFDGAYVRFTFSLPRGDKGDPGEVTLADLNGAIGGTALNPNGNVPNLDPSWNPSGDVTQDLYWLRDRMVELYNALAR